jgi:hypothetical protein
MADPSIMFAQPNAGAAFAQAFQQGMAQNQERAKRQAMAALMADPNNGQAMNALAQMDPQAAMQFKSQQAEALKAQLAQHQDSILKGAEIIRQFQPKDQASYSQALQAAHIAGVDISQVPQEYNPQYVDGVVKLADALKPQSAPPQPNIAREVDYYRSIGRDDLAQQLLTNHANPMQAIRNEDGTITLVRPPVMGGGPGGAAPPPPPPGFVLDNGGPTQPASGNFPN